MTRGDPDYSPAYQDEYQRLWHNAAAELVSVRAALETMRKALAETARKFTLAEEEARLVRAELASVRAQLDEARRERDLAKSFLTHEQSDAYFAALAASGQPTRSPAATRPPASSAPTRAPATAASAPPRFPPRRRRRMAKWDAGDKINLTELCARAAHAGGVRCDHDCVGYFKRSDVLALIDTAEAARDYWQSGDDEAGDRLRATLDRYTT